MKTYILYLLLCHTPGFEGVNQWHAKEDKTDYNTYNVIYSNGNDILTASFKECLQAKKIRK